MIFTRLYGGMGNQMFQYAFSRKLQIKYGGELFLDVSKGTEYASMEADKCRASILSEFCIPKEKIHFISNKDEFEAKAGRGIKYADFLDKFPRAVRKMTQSNTLYKTLTKKIQHRYNQKGFFTAYDSFSEPNYPDKLTNAYVNGLFSSPMYFNDIFNVLKKEFEPSHDLDFKNAVFSERISKGNSVCVHVRKGKSYIENPYLNVCTGEYFNKAMDEIEKFCSSVVFYIFSNDFSWCKKNMDISKHNCILVDANDGQHAVDELRLMKNCKHFILSNSTMGWWAQYLNEYCDKIVVSPSIWTKGSISLLNDLLEDKWIKIEV